MFKLLDYIDIGTNLLKAHFTRRFNIAPPPRVIAYTVTWRCNASCDMCGIKNVDSNLKKKEHELTAKDISRIFKDPYLKNIDLIRFTGGEPFIKEDFEEVVNEIFKNTKTKIYYITTNGYYSQRIFKFIEDLAPKMKNLVIQISLDAIGEEHDKIRKIPKLNENITNTLRGLSELRKKYKFYFGINQTVTVNTVQYIDRIAELCDKYKCDHKIYLAYEVHESDILEGRKLYNELKLYSDVEDGESKKIFQAVRKHYKMKSSQKRDIFSPRTLWDILQGEILEGSENRIFEQKISPNPPCLALFFYLRLLPDGKIMPCTLKPEVIGDLKNQSFKEVWCSKKARDVRSEIRRCKGCWVECDIVPNIVYSPHFVKKIFKKMFFQSKR